MRTQFLLPAMIILLAACNHSSNDLSDKREMFDAEKQEVITSSANQKQETMTILFGNSAARQAALDSTGKHSPGELFTLVTWKQLPHPKWYGSQINGRIKTVETVSFSESSDHKITFEYQIKGAPPEDIYGHPIDQQHRISLILNQKPSVFP